jgi:hypothetical protein
MATLNRPDKITLDAYSDPNLELVNGNGVYNRFTNQLRTPILNAKGIQLLNANFINSILQLNDNSQLVFWYYVQNTATSIRQIGNLKCVRLLPSTFVPRTGYTSFTRNRYFNSVTELVAALNTAASTGGDDVVYNPMWVANQVQFSYDTTTRKISVTSTNANFIAPAAADDPFVIDRLRGTTDPTTRIRMNGYTSSGTYATATLQPYVEGVSMNARLGFAMGFGSRGLWWNGSSTQGCATSTGVPFATGTLIEADSPPILLGSQNCSIYLSIVTGSGMDSTGRKNLIATIPIEVAPLNINSYTLSSVEKPAISVPTEIYEITAELLDDYGQPFLQPGNYNTNLSFSVYY